MLSDLRTRLRALVRRKKVEAELDEELRFHLEQQTLKNMQSGMNREEAARQARIELGGLEQAKEETREARGISFIETTIRDVHYGLRQLRRSPGFAIVAVLILTLGIGMNTVIFSLANAVLFEPLPFREPGRLVQLWETERGSRDYFSSAPYGSGPLTGPAYLDWQSHNHTLAATSLYSFLGNSEENLSGVGRAEPVQVIKAQANFFSTLGVRPFLGRTFAAGEDAVGNDGVAVVSYGLWQAHFSGRSDAVGRVIELDDRPYSVIGVMPRWLNFPTGTQIWIPIDMSQESLGGRGNHHLFAIARMRSQVNPSQVEKDLDGIEATSGFRYPDRAIVVPLQEQLTHTSRTQLLVLLGAVALVLLIACANLAGLLLARAWARQREIAVRAALGAWRGRLVHQLLTESVLLALAGAALGFSAAYGFIQWLKGAQWLPIPRAHPIGLDWRVLIFTVAISVAAGILFGLAPMLQLSCTKLIDGLKSGPATTPVRFGNPRLLREGLVIAEVALSLALLTGAGLLLRTFSNMRGTNIGARTDGLLTASVSLPEAHYANDVARKAFVEHLQMAIRNTPGVSAAALSWNVPLERNSSGPITLRGNAVSPLNTQVVEWNFVTQDYFRAYSIPILHGRGFSSSDFQVARAADVSQAKGAELRRSRASSTPPVPAVINLAAARKFWPGQNPVGKGFSNGDEQCTVVGVAGDVRKMSITQGASPEAYLPFTLGLNSGKWQITIKTPLKPLSLVPSVREAVSSLDNSIALSQPRTMRQVVADHMELTTLQAVLFSAFGAVALLLACIGIYGVVAFVVFRRTHEIGIRMALGARRRDVLRLVVGQGLKLAVIGVAVGLAGAFLLTRFLSSLLYGVKPTDPLTYLGSAVILIGVALTACYLPARRAMRINPMEALRHE